MMTRHSNSRLHRAPVPISSNPLGNRRRGEDGKRSCRERPINWANGRAHQYYRNAVTLSPVLAYQD